MWWLLLLACNGGGDTESRDTESQDTGVEDTDPQDTGDTGHEDTDQEECDLLAGGLVLPQERVQPGTTVTLSVAEPVAEATYTWSVEVGEVSPEAGAEVQWTVPASAAPHMDELVGVEVTADAPDCAQESDAGEVELGHPESARVVVVYNPGVDGSLEVAQYYAAFREIPEAALCPISSSSSSTLADDEAATWLGELQACIDAVGPQVHYVVPVFGVPMRVSGRIDDIGGGGKVTTSLDALAFMGVEGADLGDAIYNPAYQDGDSMAGTYDPWVPFGELREDESLPMYLVSRMDGVDAAAAMDLVDRTAAAEALAQAGALEGVVYVDGRYGDTEPTSDDFGSYNGGEWNMWGTKAVFEDLDWYEVVWDGNSAEFGTSPAPTWCEDALYYAGWYSYNHYNDAFEWAPGAIGGHLDSCSACNIRGSTSWSALALQKGITATFGAVGEPYVAGMPEYDQLFLYLTQGASYGEAAYESTIVGAWMMMFVGDPLYRPYPQ